MLQFAQIVADQLQIGHRIVAMRLGIHAQALRFQRFTQGYRFTGVADDTRRVEVNIGQRGEKRARRKVINVVINDAIFTGPSPPRQTNLAKAAISQILQIGRFSCFTAHSLRVGAAVSGWCTDGLFTLHTKHGHTF
ncbi:Uncharacterised protein [Salmonella enterica subsp. enterica]|nr:Uncharacterised protein [Salmonella enterica subsp. enterica]